MGAKQSKRSVDISGKEAEGGAGGEVAAAGAGGEGRVERLADADALKPQLNGDAHMQPELTDKEKVLDSGTPENEKDATTEKEGKEEDDKVTEAAPAPATNGDTEQKAENGESTPAPEDGKKPKKEKVKKKWSLRSISFSRKDKPKQEKKQKEEEAKTNGEPEKVPEETAEAIPATATNEVAEEAQTSGEEKDEKTPETPVTEPITNGTSTPESAAAATPADEAPALSAPAAAPAPAEPAAEPQHEAPAPAPEPEQLPVNGLSLEESIPETPEVEKPEETKPEPPATETAVTIQAPEIPKEVCVERMPLLEPTPPPLPANPPPSSVAFFAATTMAPELTDASLPNTAPLSALPDTAVPTETPAAVTDTETVGNELASALKESNEKIPTTEVTNQSAVETPAMIEVVVPKPDETDKIETVEIKTPELIETISDAAVNVNEALNSETPKNNVEAENTETFEPVLVEDNTPGSLVDTLKSEILVPASETVKNQIPEPVVEIVKNETPEPVVQVVKSEIPESIVETVTSDISETVVEAIKAVESVKTETPEIEAAKIEMPESVVEALTSETGEIKSVKTETSNVDAGKTNELANMSQITTQIVDESDISESLPEPETISIPEAEDFSEAIDPPLPPPPAEDETINIGDKIDDSLTVIPEPIATETNRIEMTNGNGVHIDEDTSKKVKGSALETIQCNGGEESAPASAVAEKSRALHGASPAGAAPPAEPAPQDPISVSDKLADMIPEVPELPELNTETLQETATEVAVGN